MSKAAKKEVLHRCLNCGRQGFIGRKSHICEGRGFKETNECDWEVMSTAEANPSTALVTTAAPDLVMEVQTAGDDRVKEAAQQLEAAWKDVDGAKKTTMRKALGFGALMISTKAWGKETKLIPHGTFDKWVAKHCPQVPRRTAKHYAEITEKFLNKQKGSVALLKIESPEDLAKALLLGEPSPELDALCDGETQRGLLGWQDEEEAEEKPKAGGFCPPEKKVQAWLKEHYPELVGTKFKKLPKAIAKAFQKQFLAGPRKDPEKEHAERVLQAQTDGEGWIEEGRRIWYSDDTSHIEMDHDLVRKVIEFNRGLNADLTARLKAGKVKTIEAKA